MKKVYTVKAIGVKLYREKEFATAEEAHKYAMNLYTWYNKVRTTTATATMWVDTDDRKEVIRF